jgi:hypothetical protein
MRCRLSLAFVFNVAVLCGCEEETRGKDRSEVTVQVTDATAGDAFSRDAGVASSAGLDASVSAVEASLQDLDASNDPAARSHATGEVAARDATTSASAPVSDARADPAADAATSSQVPANPWVAANGLATQHGDSAASDSSPFAGPGSDAVRMQRVDLLAACPSLLVTKAGQLLAVCTQILDRAPTVSLFAAGETEPLSTLALSAGSLFGGVYPYLDQQDQLVIVDGTNQLLHVAVTSPGTGSARLEIADTLDLSAAIGSDCGRPGCDGVVGLIPDYDGRIWFATDGALVGFVDQARQIRMLPLGTGERVANSIASAPSGVAVVSDHALYLLRADEQGAPAVVFRASYERGNARKPGQLSQGSGSTPTFMRGPSGVEYVAILDNAQPMNLLLYEARAGAALLCSLPLPLPTGYGSESSPIGAGGSVFVSSTYGYPYADAPEGSAPTVPESAPLLGGLTRVDLDESARLCSVAWTNPVRSAAVPKLSLADGHIYTFERSPSSADGVAGLLDSYAYVTIAADTGRTDFRQELPDLPDTMELAGTLAPDGSFYQGTLFGFAHITR